MPIVDTSIQVPVSIDEERMNSRTELLALLQRFNATIINEHVVRKEPDMFGMSTIEQEQAITHIPHTEVDYMTIDLPTDELYAFMSLREWYIHTYGSRTVYDLDEFITRERVISRAAEKHSDIREAKEKLDTLLILHGYK